MAPYSSYGRTQVPTSPQTPHLFEKMIVTTLTCGGAPAPTSDGVRADSFSLAAAVKILATSSDFPSTPVWEDNDRIFFFGWTYPVTIQKLPCADIVDSRILKTLNATQSVRESLIN